MNTLRGPPALSRLLCLVCDEETLHRGRRCVHCGTELKFEAKPPPPIKRFRAKSRQQ